MITFFLYSAKISFAHVDVFLHMWRLTNKVQSKNNPTQDVASHTTQSLTCFWDIDLGVIEHTSSQGHKLLFEAT